MRRIIDKRYKILRKLGSGAMGDVYKVEDLSYNKIIALKIISKKMASSAAVIRFKREFRLLAELHHPNLCEVYDYGMLRDDRTYFTMEYVEGENIFKTAKNLSREKIYPLIVQLCRILEYIHSKGLIHHDIKPGNIFVQMADGKPVVKLMDFGLAGEQRIKGGVLIRGTFPYIAPEVVKGLAIDHRADLFSLGVLLYEIFTQRKFPIKDKESFVTLLKQQENIVSELPSNIVSDVPKRLENLIRRLLEFEPTERCIRANEVINEINKITNKKFELETEKTIEGYLMSSRFVGREKEMELVKSLYEQARRGKGKVVLITGDAGVGKSRLLKEFKIFTQMQRSHIFIGYTSKDKIDSLESFHDIFRELINYIDDGTELKLSLAVLFKLFPDLADGHLRKKLPKLVPLEPQQEKLRNFEALSELLRYSASRLGELVILLEDLHWADDLTIQFLEYMGRNLADRNILICGTSRKHELDENIAFKRTISNLKKEDYLNQLELKPLNFKNLHSFLDSTITPKSNSPSLVKYLLDKTGGNPYFVEEIMRTLVHKKGVSIGEKIELEHLHKISIPGTIEEVVLKRFKELSNNSKRVVKFSALLLKDFNFDLMKRLTSLENIELSRTLWELKRKQILLEDGGKYHFYHATLREAINKRMVYREKRKLYYQIGKSLELIYKKNTEKVVEDLAFYFINAKDSKKGIIYGLKAAKRSSERYTNEQAIRFYKGVFGLLAKKDIKRRFDISHKLASIEDIVGNYDDAVKHYNKVLNLETTSINKRILIYIQLGNIYDKRGEYNRALHIYRKGVKFLKGMKQSKLKNMLEVFINAKICRAYLEKGDYKSASRFNFDILKTLKHFGGKEAIRLQGVMYVTIGDIESEKGEYGIANFDMANYYYEKAYECFKKIKSVISIGRVLNNLGVNYEITYDFEKSFNCYRKAIQISERIGDAYGLSNRLFNLSNVLITTGSYLEALDCLYKSLALAKKTGNPGLVSYSFLGIGLCFLNLCNYKKAKEYLEKAFNLYDVLKFGKDKKLSPIIDLGNMYYAIGDYTLAFKFYRRALKISKDIKHQRKIAYLLVKIGSVFMEIGEFLKAKRYIEDALKIVMPSEIQDRKAECYIALCRIEVILKDYDTAVDYYRKGIKIARGSGLRCEILRLNILNSDLHYHKENCIKGSSIADKAIKLANDIGTKDLLVEALLMKVKNGVKQGILSKIETLKLLNEAKDIAEEIGCPEVLWKVYFEYGRFLQEKKDYLEALEYYQQCVDVFKDVVSKIKNEFYKRSYLNRPDRQVAMRQPALLISKYKEFLKGH